MNVNPGEFNKKIIIRAAAGAPDADGYRGNETAALYECYAKFTRTSGTEMFKSGADMGKTSVRFLMRTPKLFTPDRKMLVEYAGKKYSIEYVNDYNDTKQYTELWCTLETTEAKL